MRSLYALMLTASLSAASWAAPQTFVIDNTHTYPQFSYNHLGYSQQTHRFTKTQGQITLDREANSGSVEVTIDANSVDTGYALFNSHLKGEAFFHTEKYPTLSFKSTRMHFEAGQPSAVDGELTIKGITQPVSLQITSFHCMPHPMLKKEACGANATVQIKRSAFDMSKNVPYVSDEVTLTIPVEAIAQ